MWPWGHLAVGYVLYAAFVRLRYGRSPAGTPTLVLAFGTQFPDLVDKPLAWTVRVLPSGRSFAHSLLTALVVITVTRWYCRRHGYDGIATAFAIGYLSHLFADAIGPLVAGEYVYLSFLGWPLLPPPPYGAEGGFLEHFRNFELTSRSALEIALAGATVTLWLRDGAPGLATLRSWIGRRSDRITESDR